MVLISLGTILGIVAAYVMLQSGHHLVKLLPLCRDFSICKTAHKMWLRILSVALEEELRVLDFSQ